MKVTFQLCPEERKLRILKSSGLELYSGASTYFYQLFLPAVESGESGGWDVHAVDADEGEEGVAEFLDFFGVELLAVGGEIVEEGIGKCRGHVASA